MVTSKPRAIPIAMVIFFLGYYCRTFTCSNSYIPTLPNDTNAPSCIFISLTPTLGTWLFFWLFLAMISSSTPAIEGRPPSQSQPQPDSSYSLDSCNSNTWRPNSIGSRSPKQPGIDFRSEHEVENVDSRQDDFPDSQLTGFSNAQERRIRQKVDFRLCTIAGILCSLNLLDSNVLSSAAVTSMPSDLGLDQGNRFSVSIFIFTVASIVFQLPSTIAVRTFGPRIWFSFITFSFGIITLSTGFVKDWKQMMALRVLLGATSSSIYPGLSYLISCWYPRREHQVRFAFMQSGEVIILATGSLVNYGLEQRNGGAGLEGWRWMFIVQGLCTCVLGIATYWWIVDFPENSHKSFWFLTPEEADIASRRIEKDRGDLIAQKFSLMAVVVHARDFKVWVFACLFFMQNVVSTALAYFVPIILEDGLGYSPNQAIILSAPPYYYAVVPVILSSLVADRFRIRGPIITFNALCMITGFAVLGFTENSRARYFGVFLSTGAYVANWAALSAYQANNVVGQWKRVFTAAVCTMFNGAGGIAGSYIVRNVEAPRYTTAVWVSIGSHIMMILLVGVLTLYFYFRNSRAARTNGAVERTAGFRYTY